MPFRRKRVHFKKKPTMKKLISKTVKNIIGHNEEKKWFATGSNGFQGITSTGVMSQVLSPANDATSSGRVGDKLKLTNLEVRLQAYGSTTGGGLSCIRYILFQWYNETVPVIGDILYITGTSLATTCNYNPTNQGLFHIFYDTMIPVGPPANNPEVVRHKKLYKFGRSTVQFNAGVTTGHNIIWEFKVSDDGVTTFPQLCNECIIHYTDA